MAIVIVIIVALSNVPPINAMFGKTDCSYSNNNGTFTFEEVNFKERNFDMCQRKFSEFRKTNNADTVLYRLCKKNFLQFWNYGAYVTDKRFKLAYMPWSSIEQRRGKISAKSGFQDF